MGDRIGRSKVEGRRSKVEGRRSKVEGRRSKVEGRRSKVEGRRSKVSRAALLVAADGDYLGQLAAEFQDAGWRPSCARNVEEARKLARAELPSIVVTELLLGERNGLALIADLRKDFPRAQLVLLTAHFSARLHRDALAAGATACLRRPTVVAKILRALSEGSVAGRLKSLALIEREAIDRTLDECDGNISEAARRLNVPRRTLQRKLAKNRPSR